MFIYLISKKKFTWRIYVLYFRYRIIFNLWLRLKTVSWVHIYENSDLHTPYFNWNDKRKLNTNDVSNDWNDHNRFVFVHKYNSFLIFIIIDEVFYFLIHEQFDYTNHQAFFLFHFDYLINEYTFLNQKLLHYMRLLIKFL